MTDTLKRSETIVPPSGTDSVSSGVLFALSYFLLRALLRIGTDDVREREAEILVLRHQLSV
jgi:hypothetical protein